MNSTSYWFDTPPPVSMRAAPVSPIDDVEHLEGVDVLVVGAGMAGLCTAARLHERGVHVGLVDAGEVAGRTTGHTTAKITALHGTIYQTLQSNRGHEVAAAYAAANRAAVADLRDLVDRWDLSCEFTTATALTCAATPEGVAEIEAEVEAAERAGLPVRFTTASDLPVEVFAAVALDGEAHFHPLEFARGVAARLRAEAVPVVEHLRVTDIDEERHGCTVTFENGRSVTAARVVQTTHLPITDPGLLAARVRPVRSYAVAGPTDVSSAGMYLAADAGWSFRPIGGGSPVCIVGGEGHPMAADLASAERYDRLVDMARHDFGVDVTHRWSAFDFAPVDGLPFIGRLAPGASRRFVATGFGKWGMSTSMVAAAVLADMLDNRTHPHAHVFDATRLLPTLGRDVIRNNAQVAARFVGDRFKAAVTLPDLGIGEGAVTHHNGTQVAVARDRDGQVHAVSAICTHLGCVVGFNDGDQTWDCPCHGSRFALDGSVLDGPATDPLEHVDHAEDSVGHTAGDR
jgi:glycine/D-amino acid oxidase-like deaminating enzyme/nitrite reductase/ring-hydroxylating ferredoxin subunit